MSTSETFLLMRARANVKLEGGVGLDHAYTVHDGLLSPVLVSWVCPLTPSPLPDLIEKSLQRQRETCFG